jgi:hypothetical protein
MQSMKRNSALASCAVSRNQAAATWTRVEVLQECREACGGMGFLAANKIGPMITDTNVDVTFEGGWAGARGAPQLASVARHVWRRFGGAVM